MQWAKICSQVRFNLATSGLTSVPISEFPFRPDEIEVTGPGGYGYEPLQQRIAQHTGAPEKCVIAATGTSMANHLAIAAVLEPGDEVLAEKPGYSLHVDVARYLGARVTRISRKLENGFAVNPAAIEKAMTPRTRLVVLSNMHNPSGALIPAETLRAIGAIARRAGIHVLVDEVYLEMLFAADAPFAFHIGEQLGSTDENPFITTNSLTKTYGLSGLRCGWVLAAPELIQRMWRLNDLFGVNAAHPAELMSVMAFDHLSAMRQRAQTLLQANHALLNSFLDSRTDLKYFRPSAGTVVFPRLISGNVDEFLKLLRDEYETSVVPGHFFDMPEHFRIGIGGETEQLRAGLERLTAALDEFQSR